MHPSHAIKQPEHCNLGMMLADNHAYHTIAPPHGEINKTNQSKACISIHHTQSQLLESLLEVWMKTPQRRLTLNLFPLKIIMILISPLLTTWVTPPCLPPMNLSLFLYQDYRMINLSMLQYCIQIITLYPQPDSFLPKNISPHFS